MLAIIDSPVYNADVLIVNVAMFALFFVALGSALKQRSRYNVYLALTQLKTLSGLIPICAMSKKIRDDNGLYMQLGQYIRMHSAADFSHGLCPACADTVIREVEVL